jgi:glycosyltransferase involved in cell wall biosynthesis
MLEKKTQDLDLGAQITFAGYVKNAAQLMNRHQVCIHAAHLENLPITLIEAMARGKPVIAAAVGGIPEVFDDGVEGLYLPLDQAHAAAKILVALLDTPAFYSAAAQAARARFLERFDTRIAAKKLFGFLQHTVGEG